MIGVIGDTHGLRDVDKLSIMREYVQGRRREDKLFDDMRGFRWGLESRNYRRRLKARPKSPSNVILVMIEFRPFHCLFDITML